MAMLNNQMVYLTIFYWFVKENMFRALGSLGILSVIQGITFSLGF